MSTSERPCHLSGSGRSAFASSSNARRPSPTARPCGWSSPCPRRRPSRRGRARRTRRAPRPRCTLARHEQLHAARLVADGGERQLALPAHQQDAPGHPHARRRSRCRARGRRTRPAARRACGRGRSGPGTGRCPVPAASSRSASRRARSAGTSSAGRRPVVGRVVVGRGGHPADARASTAAAAAHRYPPSGPWRPDPHHGRRRSASPPTFTASPQPRGSVVVAHGFTASATHADVEALAAALWRRRL